jgi:hypothetical protein
MPVKSKSFFCSGMKARFRQDAKEKAFTSYRKKMTKSIAISDYVLASLFIWIYIKILGLSPRLFIHSTLPAISDNVLDLFIHFDRHYISQTYVLVCLFAAHQQRFSFVFYR